MSTYRMMISLKPTELFEIITAGYCDEYFEKFKKEVVLSKGEWYLDNWYTNVNPGQKIIELNLLDFYLSDTGFSLYTSREESKRLELEFKSLGIFTEVWSNWYGGKTWIFGFNYSQECFNKLYLEYQRIKKIDSLIY